MNTGEIYRVIGEGVYTDVKIVGCNDDSILCERLRDGEIIEVEQRIFKHLRKKLLSEAEAYGMHCVGGRCEF